MASRSLSVSHTDATQATASPVKVRIAPETAAAQMHLSYTPIVAYRVRIGDRDAGLVWRRAGDVEHAIADTWYTEHLHLENGKRKGFRTMPQAICMLGAWLAEHPAPEPTPPGGFPSLPYPAYFYTHVSQHGRRFPIRRQVMAVRMDGENIEIALPGQKRTRYVPMARVQPQEVVA